MGRKGGELDSRAFYFLGGEAKKGYLALVERKGGELYRAVQAPWDFP